MKPVSMIDLPLEYATRKVEYDEAMQAVLQAGDFIKGKAVTELEHQLGQFLNIKHSISCANGTDALEIALRALNIGEGDEVIVPAFSYVAALEVVSLVGAQPVLVDVDEYYFQIDVTKLKSLINTRTKAIIAVHLFGQAADVDELLEIAKAHQLYIIEDNAQSFGGMYQNQYVGTFGHISCTSFFPTKNLACYGDGGAIFTQDDALAKKIKMMANHGQSAKYHHEMVGKNSRLDTLQAAILQVKLRYLKPSLAIKAGLAGLYQQLLLGVKEISLPRVAPHSQHSWNQFTIRVHQKRDELKKFLAQHGVQSMIYYPKVLSQQPAYASLEKDFPVAQQLTKEVLSLPIHDQLKEEDIQQVAKLIKEFYG
ncbi:DegT/DnrJ/EryC1/StrS family aminotransferase [Pedobacter glucosidilyticus]|uniref:DegT/DnrJ/EryC1/StrS family aminotransferase n=1 Tax=Pedobacter glucosidilyticus TaxID=1122941 RepID=UPI0026EF4E27|nr:DegT/DnrJ/EryC1/StrS family aminotransferase [Pedobacter glucosidilyticus]